MIKPRRNQQYIYNVSFMIETIDEKFIKTTLPIVAGWSHEAQKKLKQKYPEAYNIETVK
jgi:hypothetical protein